MVRDIIRSSTSAGNSGAGVYQSLDNGTTWTLFPAHDLRRGRGRVAICPTPPSPTSTCRWATSTRTRAWPTWPALTTRTIRRPTPDPDLLLATTYGRGSFAINLAPLTSSRRSRCPANASGIAADGTPIVDAPPTLNGLSAITGLRQRHPDHDRGRHRPDPTYGEIIGGFDPSQGTAHQRRGQLDRRLR